MSPGGRDRRRHVAEFVGIALVMAALALSGAAQVVRQAVDERRRDDAPPATSVAPRGSAPARGRLA